MKACRLPKRSPWPLHGHDRHDYALPALVTVNESETRPGASSFETRCFARERYAALLKATRGELSDALPCSLPLKGPERGRVGVGVYPTSASREDPHPITQVGVSRLAHH